MYYIKKNIQDHLPVLNLETKHNSLGIKEVENTKEIIVRNI